MKNKEYYEPRYLSKSKDDIFYSIFDETRNFKNLKDYTFEFNKIILLGNPGIGKTKELNRLFEDLWLNKESTGLIPFLINLKDFRKINQFDDLIKYKDWKSLPNIIFILDGLDEIAEIHDFISALELFISKNSPFNIKFVISCRTNIYEKYFINISDFQTLFIENLTIEQSTSILFNKYAINVSDLNIPSNSYHYLQTPFFIDLLAEYFLNEGKLPKSDLMIWDLYIQKVISRHQQKNIKKGILNDVKLIENLKKVAFVNELMQKNYSTKKELHYILLDDYIEFIENPFFEEIKTNDEQKKWSFEHRQLQEFFVAKSLSEKNFDEIISIIKIPKINAVHPSLFNTTTFLINLLDKEADVYNCLIDWIKQYQIELLFKADSDRIEDLKVTVFQEYFHKECIEKTLWISTNKSFTVSDIAQFADCTENYEYLLDIINNRSLHFRVTISAIDLLEHFRIMPHKIVSLKDNFFELLQDHTIPTGIKSQILNCIAVSLLGNDIEYLNKIFNYFSTETNKEINSSLLSLIWNYEKPDNFIEYILQEFLRDCRILPRHENDEVMRGNSWMLQKIILNLNDENNFINIISYYFNDKYHLVLDNNFALKILDRTFYFTQINPNFIYKLLSKLEEKFSYNERLLANIIIKSNSQSIGASYILSKFEFSETRNFISLIANEDIISLVHELYINNKIDDSMVEMFRNSLSFNNNLILAKKFDEIMTNNNFKFKNELFDEKAQEKHLLVVKIKNQKNFNILFNSEKLLNEIKEIFIESDDKIDIKKIIDIEHEWFRKNQSYSYPDTAINIIHKLAYNNGQLNYSEIEQFIITDEIIIYDHIKSLLKKKTDNTYNDFEVSKLQIKKIKNWVIKTSKKIDFSHLIILHNVNSFTPSKDYEKVRLILFFQQYFNFKLPKSFLINCIEYFDINTSSSDDESFEKLFTLINDKNKFDNQIIKNLKSNKLFSFSLSKHIDYALKNHLSETYVYIREYFKNNNSLYINNKKLENYINITNDIDLLKECCSDIKTITCWTAIKILLNIKKEIKFCIEKALEYINTNETNYLPYAMDVLFESNDIRAIKYYHKYLSKGINTLTNNSSNLNYTTFQSEKIIKSLFNTIYIKNNDRFIFNGSDNFFSSYITNLSREHEKYSKVQTTLKEIKNELEIQKTSDTGIFYINLLIDKSNNSYINSMSKPSNFTEALERVNQVFL